MGDASVSSSLYFPGAFKYVYLLFMLHKVGYLFYIYFGCSEEKLLSEEMAYSAGYSPSHMAGSQVQKSRAS